MRSGAASEHSRFFHEAGFYDSDRRFLDLAMPFIMGGVEAGEPTVVACSPANNHLIQQSLGDVDSVVFVPQAVKYSRPASTIRSCREMVGRFLADGGSQARVIGDVPHSGTGTLWEQWARYESYVNVAYNDLPIFGLCSYDLRVTTSEVIEDVESTHPYLADDRGESRSNPRYQDPAGFAAGRQWGATGADRQGPDLQLRDPTPAEARSQVERVAREAKLARARVDDLLLAVSEAVTNAIIHGRPPVALRAWRQGRSVVVEVEDKGEGPSNPYVGLMPEADGGMGLWMISQLCDEVGLGWGDHGFTLRLGVAPVD